ncbi:MAG: hypothetical protein IJ914_04730 [Prevotella sp.]|nr:hypothetical protein [Prevotella sp.]
MNYHSYRYSLMSSHCHSLCRNCRYNLKNNRCRNCCRNCCYNQWNNRCRSCRCSPRSNRSIPVRSAPYKYRHRLPYTSWNNL